MSAPIVLGITIRANGSSQVQGELNNIRTGLDNAGRSAENTNRSFATMARETLGVGDALKGLMAGFAALALYQSAKDIIMLADQMTLLDSRIKIATSSQQDYINSSKELVAISMRTGTEFAANATIFSRINKAMEGMGGTAKHTTALTETLSQSIRISGASVEEAASTIRQLSQAMASGVLRGDEFNSVMENAPRLAQALADGMHVSIGALRAMAEAGELTSKKVIEAIQSQSAVVAAEFAKIPLTVGAAMTNISTAFGQYILEANKGAGATEGLAQGLNVLANNLTPVIDSLLTLGTVAATVFAGQMVIALSAYVTAKYTAVTVEMAHAAAITMDLERTVALTAAQAANTTATVASLQAQLASTTAMGTRMAVANSLNVALVAQTSATAAATAATEALAASSATATLTLTSLWSVASLVNIALAFLVGWEIGTFLNKFESVRRVANDSLYAVLSLIEAVSYRWEKMFSKRDTASIDADHAAVTASLDDLVSSTNTYVTAGGEVVAISDEMKSALESLKTPQQIYNQAIEDATALSKVLNAETKQLMITEEQRLELGAKALVKWQQANAAEADAKLTKAGKEIVTLQDQYDKLTLSSEKYNQVHALAMEGTASEISEVERLSNAIHGLEESRTLDKKAMSDSAAEAIKVAKAAADELQRYNEKVLASLQGMAEARNEQLLINQGKALEAEISKNLSAMLGHQYDVREQLTQVQKDSVAAMTAETTETYKQTEAIRIQNEAWAESVRWHNELKDIQTATTDMQQLAVSAEALHNLGASNEEVKKRIDLEKTLNAEIKAHPDQDPQLITDNVIARQKASDTIAKYTDTNTSKSSEWMTAAFKKAAESIQTSFASMFENMLNGDATASFAKFADNIRKTLNQAISQQLALDLQGLFSENGSIINVLKSGLLFAFASIGSLFKKTVAPAVPSPAMTYAGAPSTGIGAMAIADSFGRDRGYEYQSQTVMAFNKSLDNLSSSLMTAFKVGIEQFGSQLSSLSVVSTVSNFLKPLTSVVEGVYQSASKLVADGLASVGSALGLSASAFAGTVATSWSAGIAASTKTVAGAYQAAESAATSSASSAMKIGGQVLGVVGAIYSVVSYFTGLGDMIKRDNAVEMISATGMMIGAIVAVFLPIVGAIIMAVSAIVGLFAKQRTPNAWINNYNPDQSGAANNQWANSGDYSAQVGKSTYAGVFTEFGALIISTHEASLSIGAMEASFRPLLNTVAAVDHRLYDTIMRVDAAFGQTGQTMEFYNNQLRSYNGNEQGGYKAKQDLSSMNTGDLIMGVYTTIVAHLAESGTKVGLAIGAWFNVIVSKFIGASKDNSMFVLGVIDSLAANIESFMAFPLELVDLIGQSVKSTSNGGTPTDVMAEIYGVLEAYASVRSGLQSLGMGGDQGAVDSGIAKFLASINSIGFAVPDAANNLLAYGIALKLSGKSYSDALSFMAEANAKFAALKGQGLDNTAINAYFGSFGLMAKLFAEAKVSFSSADLDTTAAKLNTLAQASVTLANNVIDQAIVTEKLTGVSRESAIATLVKSGKLQEATVAEALYGVSINTVTKDLLAQMGFIQQLGYLTGASLGSMNISASTWVAAAGNVVAVFGDLTKAMTWLDDVAKTFMSASDYANYSLTTIQRSMKNMVAANASLSGITAESITNLLASGGNLSAFISQLAEGSGSAAADTKNYVDLIRQEITAKKAVADATGTATTSLSGLADSIDKINAIINKNQTQSATGSTLYAALKDLIPESTLQTLAKSRSALADYFESLDKSSAAYPKIITALASVDKGIESWYSSVETAAKATKAIIEGLQKNNTDFSRRNNTDIESELYALHDATVSLLIDWKSLGATMDVMQTAYDHAITMGAEATAKAIKSIQDAFATIYKSIADKRTAIADDRIKLTAPDTLAGIQKQRAQADLLSDDYDTQMAAIDTLHALIMSGYSEQIDAAKTLSDVSKSIGDYLDKLLLNKALTTLSPEALLAKSGDQFNSQLALAQSGDKDALANITGLADSYLQSAKDYYASTEDYVAIFDQVREALAGLTTPSTLEQRTTAAVETMTTQLIDLQLSLDAIEAGQRNKETGQIDAINDSAAAILASLNAAITAIGGIEITLVDGLENFRLGLLLDLKNMILTIDVIPNIPGSVRDLAAEVKRNMELVINATASSLLPLAIKQLALDGLNSIVKMIDLVIASSTNDPATIALGLMVAGALTKHAEFYITAPNISDEVRTMGLNVNGILTKQAELVLTSNLDMPGKIMGLDALDVYRKYADIIINSDLDPEAKLMHLGDAGEFIKNALLQLTTTGAFTADQRTIIDAVDGLIKTVTLAGSVNITGITPENLTVLNALPNEARRLTLNQILSISGLNANTSAVLLTAPNDIRSLTINEALAQYAGFINADSLAVLRALPDSTKSLTLAEAITLQGLTTDARRIMDTLPSEIKALTLNEVVNLGSVTDDALTILHTASSTTKGLTLNETIAIIGADSTTIGVLNSAPSTVKSMTLNEVLAKYSGFIDTAALAVLNSAPDSIKRLTLNEILAISGLDTNTQAILNAAPTASKSLTLAQYVSLGTIATQASEILALPSSSSKSLSAAVAASLSGNTDAAKIAANGISGTTSYVSASATLTLDSVLNNSILSYSKTDVANIYGQIATNTANTAGYLQAIYGGSALKVYSAYRTGTLATFAKGGIANEASIFGEAGPEAAVPLPDGRSIPVTLSGSFGSNNTPVDNKETVAELKQQTAELKAARREANQKADAMIQKLQMMERRLSQIESNGALAGAA